LECVENEHWSATKGAELEAIAHRTQTKETVHIRGHLENREDSGTPPRKSQRKADTHREHLPLMTSPTTHLRQHEEGEKNTPDREQPPANQQRCERQEKGYARKELIPESRDERDGPWQIQ
jgi:hypothetical protein